jgi:cysteine desulfurase
MSVAARLYADHNATSPLRPQARAALLQALEIGGNASSVHTEGRAARKILEGARESLASIVLCPPQAITFVSGATEGLHLALESAHALGFGPCFIGAGEHDAAWAKAHQLYPEAHFIPIDPDTIIDLNWLDAQLENAGPKPLAVIQAANNETGAIMPIARVSDIVRRHHGALICDATQALGKIGAGAIAGCADWTVFSSHKVGGPPGAGALITAPSASIVNLRPGGGQELGARAGTHNVPAIAGFAAAALACATDAACEAFQAATGQERDAFESAINAALPHRVILAQAVHRIANTACVALPGWNAEKQVIGLDLMGASISAGAACSSGKVKSSRVLAAAGFSDDIASSAIRVSFGWSTNPGDGEKLAALYIKCARARTGAKET